MTEPANHRTGTLSALLDSKIDTPVSNNDVAVLCKSRDHACGIVEKPSVWRIEVAVPRKVCCIAVKFRVDICQAKLLNKAKAHWHHRDAPIVL